MKHDQWLGIFIFLVLFVLQIWMQRKEQPAAKWLGGGTIVLAGLLWVLVSAAAPGIRPIGLILSRLETWIPIP